MCEYNKATLKWKEGTGGGDGAPENYCDWEKRDAELFANYSQVGKGDVLAWIYMLYQKIDYAFNIINSLPPDKTILKDRSNNIKSKRKRTRSLKLNTAEKLQNL